MVKCFTRKDNGQVVCDNSKGMGGKFRSSKKKKIKKIKDAPKWTIKEYLNYRKKVIGIPEDGDEIHKKFPSRIKLSEVNKLMKKLQEVLKTRKKNDHYYNEIAREGMNFDDIIEDKFKYINQKLFGKEGAIKMRNLKKEMLDDSLNIHNNITISKRAPSFKKMAKKALDAYNKYSKK